jgi:hypothetical protein
MCEYCAWNVDGVCNCEDSDHYEQEIENGVDDCEYFEEVEDKVA